MNVIRHEDVDRAEQALTDASVQHQLAEARVKPRIEPTGLAIFYGVGPQHDRAITIPSRREAWEITGRPGGLGHASLVTSAATVFNHRGSPEFR